MKIYKKMDIVTGNDSLEKINAAIQVPQEILFHNGEKITITLWQPYVSLGEIVRIYIEGMPSALSDLISIPKQRPHSLDGREYGVVTWMPVIRKHDVFIKFNTEVWLPK